MDYFSLRSSLRSHGFPTGHVRQSEEEDLSEIEDSLSKISIQNWWDGLCRARRTLTLVCSVRVALLP